MTFWWLNEVDTFVFVLLCAATVAGLGWACWLRVRKK